MAIQLSERVQSRAFINSLTPEIRFKYFATGTHDDAELLTYLNANIPATYSNLALQSISAEPTEEVDEETQTGRWEIEVIYARPEYITLDPTEASSSFDTSGGKQKITNSLETIAKYQAGGGNAPDMKGAIGVDDKKVNGTEIVIPVFEFQESVSIADVAMTNGYKGLIHSITGKVNDAAFKGFAAGEVLFLGATGQKRGTGLWTVQFKFAASENLEDISIGSITGIDKKGWEYLWVVYESSVDQGAWVSVPKTVYIERVYRSADFDALGIGS